MKVVFTEADRRKVREGVRDRIISAYTPRVWKMWPRWYRDAVIDRQVLKELEHMREEIEGARNDSDTVENIRDPKDER